MRRTVSTGTVACIVAAVLLGAGQAGAATAAIAAYFPLAPGTTWTYRTNTSGEIIMRVGTTARVGAHECRIIETIVSGNTTQRECYRVAADGVYAHLRSYAAGRVLLTPPQRMLATPVAVGQVWQWNGQIQDQAATVNFTWARRETTKVPAGTYDAMQLYLEGNLGPGVRVQSWRWFAPGVGMVKEDSIIALGQQTARIYAELVRVTTVK